MALAEDVMESLFVKVPGGKTLVLDVNRVADACGCRDIKCSEVLRTVQERTGIPSNALRLRGMRGLPFNDDENIPADQSSFEAFFDCGLAGGKGGFGAMLRALAKQNTGHKTTDFGACRDLNGRRLRHVNNEIKLKQWTEARDRKESLKARGIDVDSDEEARASETKTGIRGWHLGVPSWIEHVKQRETKNQRRKQAAKRKWEDEEVDVQEAGVPTRDVKGVVTMVDTVRSSFCVVDGDVYVPFTANVTGEDWGTVLKVGDELEVKAVLKPQGKNKWYAYKALRTADFAEDEAAARAEAVARNPEAAARKYSAPGDAAQAAAAARKKHAALGAKTGKGKGGKGKGAAAVDEAGPKSKFGARSKARTAEPSEEDAAEFMASAVTEGLLKSKRLKVAAREAEASERRSVLPIDLEGKMRGVRWGGDGWLGLLAGQLEFGAGGTVRGVSEFGSVCVTGVSLKAGRWYYEVELLSSGVMQVGWADDLFKASAEQEDGVGDDPHSWAYDGCRQQCWTAGEARDYGLAWAAGDVVGCLLDLDRGHIAFTLNGAAMPNAFDGLALAAAHGSGDVASPGGGGSVADAAALAALRGFYPAAAVEEGEILALRVTSASLKFGPPEGYQAVGEAMAVQPLDGSAGGGGDDDSGGGEADLAAEFGLDDPVDQGAAASSPVAEAAAEAAAAAAVPAAAPAVPQAIKAPPMALPVLNVLLAAAPVAAPVKAQALDLSPFGTAAELEALGLDRLKAALMAVGAKCGGSLAQRADRLFSLKGVAHAAIDPKLLAPTEPAAKREKRSLP